MHEIFKDNIRRALAERDLTQESFARQQGFATRTVAGWCLGETVPRKKHLDRIAEAFDRDIAWFFIDRREA